MTEARADVDAKTEIGATPLYIAVEKGHLDLARFLVTEARADVEAKAEKGFTPLPRMARRWALLGANCPSSQRVIDNFFARCVMLQNRKRMVNELASALITLTAVAAYTAGTNMANNRASNMNIGAPGG